MQIKVKLSKPQKKIVNIEIKKQKLKLKQKDQIIIILLKKAYGVIGKQLQLEMQAHFCVGLNLLKITLFNFQILELMD